MNRVIFTLFLLFSLNQAYSQDTGIGVVVGQPTGFTVKKWLGDNAVDGVAAWSIGKNPHFSLHSDYLWQKREAFFFENDSPLDMHFGVGGRVDFDDEIELGPRFPIGLDWYFNERKGELFTELAPILDIVPKTKLEIHVLIGFRYYLF